MYREFSKHFWTFNVIISPIPLVFTGSLQLDAVPHIEYCIKSDN